MCYTYSQQSAHLLPIHYGCHRFLLDLSVETPSCASCLAFGENVGCNLSDNRGPDHLNNVRVADGSSSCACTSLPWWLEASNDRRWSVSYDHSLTCRGSVWGFHSS